MKKLFYISILFLLVLTSCEIKLRPNGDDDLKPKVEVLRYDRLQSRYLTTGDFSALQQMNIDYPMETRTLIEDVLQLGEVNDPEINGKFLRFYQDTTLQSIIADAELQYANMGDINKSLSRAFSLLDAMVPGLPKPTIYAQIGSLDQSIIIGDNSIGISLDKYLGKNYPLYMRYYNEGQRKTMSREYIVPDCLCFYILAQFPLQNHDTKTQEERDQHMGKVMWTVNKILCKPFFRTPYINNVEKYMKRHPKTTIQELLTRQTVSMI